MYSFGTVPPTISFSNSKPVPGGSGSTTILTWANWPVAAGLLLVRVVDGHRPRDLLAIGDLRRADIGFDLVGALEDIDLDVEMQFAHALEDGLAASPGSVRPGTTGSSATSFASAMPSFS